MTQTNIAFFHNGLHLMSIYDVYDSNVKKGDVIYLEKSSSYSKADEDHLEFSKWKIVSVDRTFKRHISPNKEPTDDGYLIPFKIISSSSVEIAVVPHKVFRCWIRPSFMRKKKFIDFQRNKDGIIEIAWFGFSYR